MLPFYDLPLTLVRMLSPLIRYSLAFDPIIADISVDTVAVQKTADREVQLELIRPAERHQAALCPPQMTSFSQRLFRTYPSSTPDST